MNINLSNQSTIGQLKNLESLAKGRFEDGWIACDQSGDTFWYKSRPFSEVNMWEMRAEGIFEIDIVEHPWLVWPKDLDWSERIFEVKNNC